MKLKDFIAALIFILASLSAGFLGAIYTASNVPTWYAALNKPVFNPPNYLFGPVWTFLYISMGIAAFLVWKKGIENRAVRIALGIFAAQLILNAAWTPLFFGLHWMLLAFVEIIVLWLMILWTMVKFYPLSKAAGLLLVPYFLWVGFASALNFALWCLNR